MLATASADGFIMLWETGTWKEIKTLDGHREWVWDLAWACDGKYIISGTLSLPIYLAHYPLTFVISKAARTCR